MMLGRVVGNVVATAKHPGMDGKKMLLIQPLTPDGREHGRVLVALDAVGAGFRETVYWCRGRESALAFTGEVPCDAAVVAIVDSVAATPGRAAKSHAAPNKSNARRPR